ncbi:hypothetical protein NMA58_24255 (plasmid) [Rhizobium sp. YTUHZ045]|uniref:hypothetical protein n=1 Tax=Rhizobium sp. YTUHZ045 TaxID=2962888 RepID=UPI003DA83E53
MAAEGKRLPAVRELNSGEEQGHLYRRRPSNARSGSPSSYAKIGCKARKTGHFRSSRMIDIADFLHQINQPSISDTYRK